MFEKIMLGNTLSWFQTPTKATKAGRIGGV